MPLLMRWSGHGSVTSRRRISPTRGGRGPRQLAFHGVAGGGTDDPAGFLREKLGEGAGVAALDGFAGKDDGAAIDVGGLDVGIAIAAADEAIEFVDVDGEIGQIG